MKKKKLLSVLVAASLVMATVSGCGASSEDTEAKQTQTTTTTETSSETTEHQGSQSVTSTATLASTYDDSEDYDPDLDGDLRQANYTESSTNDSADATSDAESFTLMVYMCGSNLESESGCATSDLNEMLYGDSGTNLNIVVETGGAEEWQNSVISADTLERYHLDSSGIEKIGDAGSNCITDPNQMADFIKFAVEQYPADRYGFIFWDHGGGTIGGYGSDDLFDGKSMTLEEMQQGFKDAGVHFDFIGFDCCLMGTMETGYALKDTADYLIASEEVEPGTGWYYTNFITLLENNPGVSMKELGKQIITDYCSDEYTYTYQDLTLALIDLSKIQNVVDSLDGFYEASDTYLRDGGYSELSQARYGAKSYGDDEFEQIDMIDYAGRLDMDGRDDLIAAVQDAVVYSGTNVEGTNGLAMFYPYLELFGYTDFSTMINNLGINGSSYQGYLNDFVSIETLGQSMGGNANPYGGESEYDASDYELLFAEDWYDITFAEAYAEDYDLSIQQSDSSSETLEITDKDGVYVLSLTDESWDIVTDIHEQLYIDDGEGYLALGDDDAVSFDDDGDLIVECDNMWLYMNGCLIAYMPVDTSEGVNGETYYRGATIALLNDTDIISVVIRWDENGEATVLGYVPMNDDDTASKGYSTFTNGDEINFLFDYYDYDGNLVDSYTLTNNSIIFDKSEGLDVYYDDIGDVTVECCFYLTDIYQNEYWTQTIRYE